MKIKRYFSQDMRTAIRMVREELGPDAVIVSNNKVNGGIEVVAAVDYDESMIDTGSDFDSDKTSAGTDANITNNNAPNMDSSIEIQNQYEIRQPETKIPQRNVNAQRQNPRYNVDSSPANKRQAAKAASAYSQPASTVSAPQPIAQQESFSPAPASSQVQNRHESLDQFSLNSEELVEEFDSQFSDEEENWAYDLINPSVNHLQKTKAQQSKIDEAFKPKSSQSQSQSPYLKYRIGDNSTMEDWPVPTNDEEAGLEMPEIDSEAFSQFIAETRPQPKRFKREPIVPEESLPIEPDMLDEIPELDATGQNSTDLSSTHVSSRGINSGTYASSIDSSSSSAGKQQAQNRSSNTGAQPVSRHGQAASTNRRPSRVTLPPTLSIPASSPQRTSSTHDLDAMQNDISKLRGRVEHGVAKQSVPKKPAPSEREAVNPVHTRVLRQLSEMEVHPNLIEQIASGIQPHEDFQGAWQTALASFAKLIPVTDDDLISQGGIVSLVGSTGVGKTTTIAKLAARYALRHGRENVALITTDNYRIGALEQLRTYGRILGIPVKIANNKKQLEENLKHIAHKKFILIDTAGMSQRDVRLMEQFSLISECAPSVKNYLVMSTTTQAAAMDEIIRTFRNMKISGCVLTKVDETTNLGSALSVVAQHKIPVTYISDGQKVPEDLHLARTHMLINRALVIARKMHQTRQDNEASLSGKNAYARA